MGLVFCLVAVGSKVMLLVVNVSLCTSVETSTVVVSRSVMNSF